MIIEERTFEVSIEFKKVFELLSGAIEGRRLLRFYYESKPANKNKNGNKGYRTIRPYMIIPRGENLELVGLLITELTQPKEKRQAGPYTILQLKQRVESEQLEVLPEKLDDPGVSREIVDNTQGIPVFRFIYDDENAEQVKAGWLQLKYV